MFKAETNAKNIYSQRGVGLQTGGSVSIAGGSLGVEYLLFPNSDDAYGAYHGISYSAGIGAPIPFEMHSELTYSWLKGKNVYDTFDILNAKVMGW